MVHKHRQRTEQSKNIDTIERESTPNRPKQVTPFRSMYRSISKPVPSHLERVNKDGLIATHSPTFGRSHNPNWIVAACFSPFTKSKRQWWLSPRNRVNIPRLARLSAGCSIDVQNAIAFSPELITWKLFQLVFVKRAETTTIAIQNPSNFTKLLEGRTFILWSTLCFRTTAKMNTSYANRKQNCSPLLSNSSKQQVLRNSCWNSIKFAVFASTDPWRAVRHNRNIHWTIVAITKMAGAKAEGYKTLISLKHFQKPTIAWNVEVTTSPISSKLRVSMSSVIWW